MAKEVGRTTSKYQSEKHFFESNNPHCVSMHITIRQNDNEKHKVDKWMLGDEI